MIHPDDMNAVGDWELYGPRSAELPVLVRQLAGAGMRLDDIEALLERALRDELARRETAGDGEGSRAG